MKSKINYITYFFIWLSMLFITNCTSPSERKINQKTIEEVKSIKRNTDIKTLESVDSLLQIENITKSKKALLYFKKGKILSILQKDKEAIKSFEKALSIFEKFNNKTYIAETYWHLGSAYAFTGNKARATEYLLKALDINKEVKQQKLEANIYGSLAHVHYLYKDFDKAIGYTQKAIEIQKNIKDTLSLSATYNNLAVIYKNIGSFGLALENNNNSLFLNELLKDKNAIAKSYNNIGLVYESLSNYSKAEEFYLKSVNINSEIKIFNSSSLRNLGALYLRKKEFKKSKNSYLKALEIENETESISKLKDIYNALLNISLKEKDFEKSLLYQAKRDSLNLLKNKINNDENLKLSENQYKLIAKENELKQEKNNNKKNKIIFGILILLLFSFIIFWFLSVKNKRLKTEKEKIILEQRVLRSQMNPHFIFNALSAIQNTLLDNDPMKSATYLSRFAKLIRQNFDFINEKTILLKDEIDALINYMDTQKMRFNDKFDYEINLHSDIDINQIEIPPLLLQPFVENAIEHGFKNKKEKGILSITISKTNNTICYEIKDNGKGYDAHKKDKKIHAIDIFKKRLKLRANGDEKTFIIDSSEKGTTVKFCLKND